jgi:uncharacterized membrane protein
MLEGNTFEIMSFWTSLLAALLSVVVAMLSFLVEREKNTLAPKRTPWRTNTTINFEIK